MYFRDLKRGYTNEDIFQANYKWYLNCDCDGRMRAAQLWNFSTAELIALKHGDTVVY